jgi:hypothetical protein
MAGPVAPSGGCGNEASSQIRIIMARMVVPARLRKMRARVHRPMARLLGRGIL